MTTLLLIRHGTTAATGIRLGGRTEAPLDERGRRQAQEAGRRVADLKPGALYASPVRRTLETAELVAAELGCDVALDDGLLEVEYGRWTDRALAHVARTRRWKVVQSTPSLVAFPGGETIRGMQARAVDAVEGIVAGHRGDVVAAVSHADVIKAVVAFYVGLPLDLFGRLHVAPGSVSAMRLGPGQQPALLRFGDDGPMAARESKGSPRG